METDMADPTSDIHRTHRRRFAAAAAGVAVAAIVAASAATLGGLSADRLGADDTIVLDAADGLHLSWGTPSYDTTVGGYTVSAVTLTTSGAIPLPATADGASVKVVLLDGTGAVLAESLSVSGGVASYAVTFPAGVDASAVAAASVVVAG
jgi:hypothetical protein